ncbi:hypothetical protein KL86PLE_40989 [uncultured Pleomorphomonas sp.]|uniref:Uncharacterized protein n=1 Tax=uncultured Pleomorphomonas sp. TaxID=442121 RepID=A0A212LHZ7_9HYPH|nr:hypothetical protein KL86PLE_40989 [uncultured Pleomorphomonas sp.]
MPVAAPPPIPSSGRWAARTRPSTTWTTSPSATCAERTRTDRNDPSERILARRQGGAGHRRLLRHRLRAGQRASRGRRHHRLQRHQRGIPRQGPRRLQGGRHRRPRLYRRRHRRAGGAEAGGRHREGPRPGRYPGQQCRHHQAHPDARDGRQGLPPGDRHRPDGAVHRRQGGDPRHDQEGRRQDHQHLLDDVRARPRDGVGLRGGQGRPQDADPQHRLRVRRLQHPVQRHRPRLYRDAADRAAARGRPPVRCFHPGEDAGRPLGHHRRPEGAGGVPRLGGVGLRQRPRALRRRRHPRLHRQAALIDGRICNKTAAFPERGRCLWQSEAPFRHG